MMGCPPICLLPKIGDFENSFQSSHIPTPTMW